MSATAGRGATVILVASARNERVERVRLVLAATGMTIIQHPDVYIGLGELVSRATDPPRAVVVEAGCAAGSEAEFFSLVGRILRGGRAYVFGDAVADRGLLATAAGAGAGVLDMNGLADWAMSLAASAGFSSDKGAIDQPTVEPAPDDSLRGSLQQESSPEEDGDVSEVDSPETDLSGPSDQPPTEESDAGGAFESEASFSDDESSIGVPRGSEETEDECSANPEPKPTIAAAAADRRIARPIEVPTHWLSSGACPDGHPVVSGEDAPGPAVPWRPASGRPTRIPPTARAIEPIPRPSDASAAKLTREELDALLGDSDEPPETRRGVP